MTPHVFSSRVAPVTTASCNCIPTCVGISFNQGRRGRCLAALYSVWFCGVWGERGLLVWFSLLVWFLFFFQSSEAIAKFCNSFSMIRSFDE